jgi:hypothetical protein
LARHTRLNPVTQTAQHTHSGWQRKQRKCHSHPIGDAPLLVRFFGFIGLTQVNQH